MQADGRGDMWLIERLRKRHSEPVNNQIRLAVRVGEAQRRIERNQMLIDELAALEADLQGTHAPRNTTHPLKHRRAGD